MPGQLVLHPKVEAKETDLWLPNQFGLYTWLNIRCTSYYSGMGNIFVCARTLEEARAICRGQDAVAYNAELFTQMPSYVFYLGNKGNKGLRHCIIVCPFDTVDDFQVQDGFVVNGVQKLIEEGC